MTDTFPMSAEPSVEAVAVATTIAVSVVVLSVIGCVVLVLWALSLLRDRRDR